MTPLTGGLGWRGVQQRFAVWSHQSIWKLKVFMTSRYEHTHLITFFEVHITTYTKNILIHFSFFLLVMLLAGANHNCTTFNNVPRVVVFFRNMQTSACLQHVIIATSCTKICTNVCPCIVCRVPRCNVVNNSLTYILACRLNIQLPLAIVYVNA